MRHRKAVRGEECEVLEEATSHTAVFRTGINLGAQPFLFPMADEEIPWNRVQNGLLPCFFCEQRMSNNASHSPALGKSATSVPDCLDLGRVCSINI